MLIPRTPTVAALLLTGLAGCAAEEPIPYFDLVESFARAEAHSGTPRVESGSAQLFLPAGSSLTYSFEARPGSSLRIERVAPRGDGTRLLVRLASDAEPDLLSETTDGPARDLVIELPVAEGAAAALTLEVDASSAAVGDGVLLTAAVVYGEPPKSPTPAKAVESTPEGSRRPSVIVYLIDTLRRDRLGGYGYARPVSPHIDEFASGATLFENSVGQSSWTKASVASMWSGVWPPAHGATGWGHRLPEEFETVAERLRDAGYDTAAFVTNVNAGPAFGLSQGFEHVWYEKKRPSHEVNGEVLAWLDGRDSERPLLLYVHTMDPHAGYRPTEPFRSRFAPDADQMKPWKPRWRWPVENLPFFSDLYDGEIAQNDDAFGELTAALAERDLFEDSLVLLLSDHGEEFKEHGGWRHGRVLHHGSLDVPMIVKFPGQTEGARSRLPVSHVDVLPTILEVAGIPAAASGEGQSLVAPGERPVFSHLRLGKAPLQYGVVDGRWKLIQVHGDKPRTQLFDLVQDPGEARDLAAELPVRTALLEGLLRERLALTAAGDAEEVELTEELRNTLRALGYLQ